MIEFFKSHYLDKSETPITKDKQGIELGSGTGVLGLFIAKYAKFDKFYLTDFDENVRNIFFYHSESC
jgi:methylase of polypeptide subunit release factors